MTDTYVAPPKPPLSNPMAEALAEDAAAEAARAAQAAAEPPGATQEPEPAETPSETPVEATETTETAEPETPPVKKPAMVAAPLLAKERNKRQTAESELAEARAQLAAAQELLASAQARGDNTTEPSTAAPAKPVTQPQRVYTEAEMQEAAKQVAYYNDLNTRADQVYSAGKEKFGDWVDNVGNLVAMEVMTPQFVEAAMATGAPVDVIHHLGADLDEAARISALPPVRMGVELARIAAQSNAPAPKRAISGAPSPIEPVNGRPDPTVNLAKLAEGNDMAAYVAERKKQGDPWAR